MIKSNIGELIKNSPYKREYVQEYMGVTRNTIYNWCAGKSYPPAPEMFKLARLLKVKVDDLYEWKEDVLNE